MPHVEVQKHAHEARADPVTQPNTLSTLLTLPFKQHFQSLSSLTCLCYKAQACFFLLTDPRCLSPFDQPHLRNSSSQAGLRQHRQEPTTASSASTFAKNHKASTQFLRVYQEILHGRAGRRGSTKIHTLCNIKKHTGTE